MVFFCPSCATILLVEHGPEDNVLRFACQTCRYVHPLRKTVSKTLPLERKQVDDVLGGEETWENVDQTAARCEKCENDYAYFFQIQIRSADEPMSTFYKCTKCGNKWRED
eukprot:TRINITY_DN113_c0_g1_i1.p2 TRINITY_DN113_c0_g1~~TRINITY_DN113_c0_g1_i1.p2  ORF type:complete len:110 (+),score=11.89 TRINITY_DN113_c0_g1_i1:288-617(+)